MSAAKALPARNGGAKALLLTVLGEFVLPAGGEAWTSSLVAGASALGLGEKNARQALARISDQGFIEGARHGRSVRWTLTASGRHLLETGTKRIYEFGRTTSDWDGQWLVAHCPVAESHRAVRNELRTELGFLGFGELAASLLISPHPRHDSQLRAVLDGLGLLADSTILWSKTVNDLEDGQLVAKAWNLEDLASSYVRFSETHRSVDAATPEHAFRALVELVHDWRRFPFTDPDLPTRLLPTDWPGTTAVNLFHERHAVLSSEANHWFASHERGVAEASPRVSVSSTPELS